LNLSNIYDFPSQPFKFEYCGTLNSVSQTICQRGATSWIKMHCCTLQSVLTAVTSYSVLCCQLVDLWCCLLLNCGLFVLVTLCLL